GALRDRRLRRLRGPDDRRAAGGRPHRGGRRREDLRRPARTGDPHQDGRDRRVGRDAGVGLMPAGINAGDTAWMFVATALVLMMTPALGLFYAGLVRAKNTLNTFMMSLAAFAVVGVLWAVVGYSLAFGSGNGVIGNFDHVLLHNVGFGPQAGLTIPQ